MTDLEKLLAKISELAAKRQYSEGIALGLNAQGRYADEPSFHRKMAHLYAFAKDYEHAIESIGRAVSLEPRSPANYFSRARWYLESGRNQECIDDCTTTIQIESDSGEQYFRSTAFFFRALAKMRIADRQGALDDLDESPKNACVWALGKLQRRVEMQRSLAGDPNS